MPWALGTEPASKGFRVLGGNSGGRGQRVDVPGVVFATAGLVALVYACTQAVASGWRSATVIGFLVGFVKGGRPRGSPKGQ